MAQARSNCLLFIALCGCKNRHVATDQDPSTESSTAEFEGEWVSIESPEKRLFLGEKRWSLQQLELKRHIVGGNVAVVEKLGMSSDRDVVLSSTRDNDTGAVKEPGKLDGFCPVKHITSDYPPILMIHGTEDTDVPYACSDDMARELARYGVKHELLTVAGAEHGLRDGDPQKVAEANTRALEFIREQLTEN